MGDPFLSGPVALGLFFAVGILGSAHCVGMCGPLVSLYSDRMTDDGGRAGVRHASFNLGRVTMYAAMGGLLGVLGGSVADVARGLPAPLGNLQGVVGVGAGLVVASTGLAHLAGTPNPLLAGDDRALWSALGRASTAVRRHLESFLRGPRTFVLGFAHGLFPCPLLYPAYLYAFALGDPVVGATVLAALGAGTFPAVFLFGTLYGSATFGRVGTRAVGGAFVLLGVNVVLVGLDALGVGVPHLFSVPVASTGVAGVPVLVALPVAVVGSLLLLGVGLAAFVRGRTLSYLLLALALLAFAGQVLVSHLVATGAVPAALHHRVDLLSDAATVLLLAAAVLFVSRHRSDDTVTDPGEVGHD